MNVNVATVTLMSWIVVVLVLFAKLTPRRAVLASYFAGSLFLPVTFVNLPSFPSYTKLFAVSFCPFVGVLLFDRASLMRFRLRLFDVPVLVGVLSTVVTSMTNGLGVYDGISSALTTFMSFGVPYLLGRIYISGPGAMREAMLALVIAGLVYTPFCIWEMRMSPQLHKQVYGFYANTFSTSNRLGGYRPMVFMQHGLELGLFMCASALAAVQLAVAGAWKRCMGMRATTVAFGLLAVALLCRSFGALALLAMVVPIIVVTRAFHTRIALIAILVVLPVYVEERMNGWHGSEMAAMVSPDVEDPRRMSLEGRLYAEERLLTKAAEKPWFGWGSWGRNKVYDATGEREKGVVTDSLWIIVLGQRGMIGLIGFARIHIAPAVLVALGTNPKTWFKPSGVACFAGALTLLLYAGDRLFNAMHNPSYTLISGGLVSTVFAIRAEAKRQRAMRAAVPAPGAVARARVQAQARRPAPR